LNFAKFSLNFAKMKERKTKKAIVEPLPMKELWALPVEI